MNLQLLKTPNGLQSRGLPGPKVFAVKYPRNLLSRISLSALLFFVLVICGVTPSIAQTYTFTNAGATGKFGPTQTQVNNAYSSTSLDGKVKVTNGIQYWVVPQTGLYRIEATGAKGYGTYGGRGTFMAGDFQLKKGDTLKILVGQQAPPPVGSNNQYSGGGGTFITYMNNTPLLVAGGGAGSHATSHTTTTDASLTTSGNSSANAVYTGAGGTSGNGGSTNSSADGGGGLLTNGGGTGGGKSFLNGGAGGAGTTSGHGEGGFGGGGGTSSWDNYRAGGGGGYSGGAGAASNGQTGNPEGGGGGSYNGGIRQNNIASMGTGNGLLVIEVLSSGAMNDAGVTAIDSPNVYCSGVHNVVVSVQNFGINIIDSVSLNWSVDGVTQTPYKYIGAIDTVGGANPYIRQISIGSYNFTSAAHTVKVWTSMPNGVSDTVLINDSAQAVKQANLPPPTGVSVSSLGSTGATISWTPGSLSNTWAYVNSTSSTKPTGPGTTVTSPTVSLTGLNPRTTYYFFVREICPGGDSSVWEGPYSFRTPCSATLSGVYTIDPSQAASSTNFLTFTDAVLSLHECTITGPVEFQVAAATFNERLDFSVIPGASATNTVKFIGAGKGSTTLTYDASGTADMATVLFDGTDYVTFRDMTVRGTDQTYGIGFLLTNEADHNSFENMHIQMNNSSTGTNTAGIALTGSVTSTGTMGDNGSYNTFDSLDIEGAYYGIVIRGTSTSSYETDNHITYCTFTQQYTYPIYAYYNNRMVIDHCSNTQTRSTTGDGFYTVYLSNSRISNNTILSQDYGLYLSSFNAYFYDNTVTSMVYNNMIWSDADYGIYCTGSDYMGFYHNSVNVTSGYAARFSSGIGLSVVNNHFRNYRSSPSSYALYVNSASFDTLDYNNYMSYSTSDQFYFDGAYADFAAYRAAFPTLDEHSYNVEPNFVSNSNLHINQGIINLRGIDVGIDTDRDDDARCTFSPTLGADESGFPTPAPDAVIAVPDTVYDNSPAIFFSAFKPLANVALDYTWYLNGSTVDKGRDYIAKLAAGNYDLSLKVRSCNGSDSTTVNFDVIVPTSTPVSDFSATKLVLDLVEETQFIDLSDFGPTSWQWSASPAGDVIFDDVTKHNPKAFFLAEGVYEICLTTENALGVGTTKCKSAYIAVNDDQTFCSSAGSSHPAGRITDDGGASGIYSSNTTCSFAITPCASKVTLKFSQFDLADASDVLRVYDGEDNTGTLLGTFNGGTIGLPGGNTGLVANSGKMFLEWTTNGAGAADGFIAHWTSVPDFSSPTPVAGFAVPTTIFTGTTARFESTSTGSLLKYSWDFDPPFSQSGFEGGDKSFDTYRWNTAGVYPVELTVSNCGGTDVITQNITVVDPSTTPVVGFYADKTRVPVLNTVTLMDTSGQGPTSWKWEITPELTTNIVGPDNQEQLKVFFSKPGLYTVKLKAANINGTDSLVKANYIDVFDYCDPVASSISSDIGIGRVKLGPVDNFSSIGTVRYTSFLNDFTPVPLARRQTINITIERNSITDSMNRKVWVDWNNDGDFEDSLELVAYEPAAKTLSYTASIQVPVFASLGFTTLRVGASFGRDKNSPCGINPVGEYEDYPLQVIIDNVIPVITLSGQDTVYVEQWYQYTDAGATALDNIDGNLTSVITVSNNVDTTTAGTYYINYNVLDNDGNQAATVTRVVIVTPDVTPPVIALAGNVSETVTVNTNYTDLGATATDYFNRNLTPDIISWDDIDMGLLGTYYVYFTVEDAAGNKDSVVRTIHVVDDVDPVLTLVDNDTLVVEVNTSFTDPGYTVTDNYYSTVNVTVDNSLVKLNLVGIYPITYTAEDSSGNIAVVTRYIDVQDNTAPIITLTGDDTVTIDVHTTYFEQGAKVGDNYCPNVQWTVDTIPDTDVIGEYVLTYSAVDCHNNSAVTVTRVVRVVDRTAPMLTLNGLPTVTIMRWQPYTDAGVTIGDNYYDTTTLKGLLDITSDVDNLKEGIYSICYQVTDPSNNISNKVCRMVIVTANTTSVNNEGFESKMNLYPNPSNGSFTIDFGGVLGESSTVTIVDMTGRAIHTETVGAATEKLAVDLTHLPGGVYMARIQNGQNLAVLRFTVSR